MLARVDTEGERTEESVECLEEFLKNYEKRGKIEKSRLLSGKTPEKMVYLSNNYK